MRSAESSVWFAAPPALPPDPVLGPAVADWRPAQVRSVVTLCLAVAFGGVTVVLLVIGAYPFAATTLLVGALWALSWAGVRRTYLAVGEGWLYVRTLPVGDAWTPLSELESGRMVGKRGTTLLLRGSRFRARLPVPDASLRRPSAFHGELARRIVGRHLELDPQSRFVLQAWAGMVAADASDD